MVLHGASIKGVIDTSFGEVVSHQPEMTRVHIDAVVTEHTGDLALQRGPSRLNAKMLLHHWYVVGVESSEVEHITIAREYLKRDIRCTNVCQRWVVFIGAKSFNTAQLDVQYKFLDTEICIGKGQPP